LWRPFCNFFVAYIARKAFIGTIFELNLAKQFVRGREWKWKVRTRMLGRNNQFVAKAENKGKGTQEKQKKKGIT
jgi:hypothetical protein